MPQPRTGKRRGVAKRPVERTRRLGNPTQHALPPAPETGLVPGVDEAVVPPQPPIHLGPEGRAVWEKIWEAGSRWLSQESDVDIVAMLAAAFDERAQLADFMSEAGEAGRWYRNDSSRLFPHPAVRQLRDLDAQITAWLSMIGFTSSDRAKLGLTQARAAGELDAFRACAAARRVERNGGHD